jgi:hypothetical protein
LLAITFGLSLSASAIAQDKPKPAPTQVPGAPEAQPPAEGAAPAPEGDAPEADAPAEPAPEGDAPAAPAEPVPAEPAPAAQPAPPARQEPPPPPVYGQLGREPEPEVQEGEWDPWEHVSAGGRRHEGFFLRLSIGLGGGAISSKGHIERDFDETAESGLGLGTSIGIGGAVTDNLILYGDIFQTTVFDPTLERDNREVEPRDDPLLGMDVGDDLRLAGIGVGLVYYFMPINIYVAGSVGFGQAVFEDNGGDVAGSDIGFASNLMLGKEWWVGADWGLGLAGQFITVVTDDDILGDITGLGFNLMFSATYN